MENGLKTLYSREQLPMQNKPMTNERKLSIAASFSDKYVEATLDLILSESEFEKFEHGIYSGSMEEKWNIFLIENNMYWARSWTDHCVFKVGFSKEDGKVNLENIKVTRNPDEYTSNDLEHDIKIFKTMLNFYINR